jgi:outer membrane protein assembly factor BamD
MPHKFIITALTALVLAGCASKTAELSPTASAEARNKTAETQFKKADKLLKKKYYEQAVEAFERVRNSFPFSKFAVESELKIADALFAKGDYAEAADAYRTFAKLHPTHPKIDYAAYRVGLSLYKDAPKSIDRDQTSTERALAEFRRFLTKYPDSEHSQAATDKVAAGRARLAAKELYIGRFYYRDKAYDASIPRFRGVVERYPETAAAQEALLLQGKASLYQGKCPDAVQVMEEYLNRYPDSEQASEARRTLRACGSKKPKATKSEATASTPGETKSTSN